MAQGTCKKKSKSLFTPKFKSVHPAIIGVACRKKKKKKCPTTLLLASFAYISSFVVAKKEQLCRTHTKT
jgi:hypothetical protein